MYKTFLGDGVYAEVDHGCIELTTDDGILVTNRIILEPDVLEAFEEYLAVLEKAQVRPCAKP